MTILIKTIHLENGSLYCLTDGERRLLARCGIRVEVYEDSVSVPILGSSCKVKKRRAVIMICSDVETTRDIDEQYLNKVSGFEAVADYQRQDGIFERVRLDGLIPREIDLDGEWRFEVLNMPNILKR